MMAVDRPGQAEIAAQRRGLVFGAEQAAALQFGNDEIDEVLQIVCSRIEMPTGTGISDCR